MHLRYRDMDLGAYVDLDEVRNMVSVYLVTRVFCFYFIHSFIRSSRTLTISGLYNDSTLFPYTSGTEV